MLLELCPHNEVICKICHPSTYKKILAHQNKKFTKKELGRFKQAVKEMQNNVSM